MKFSVEYIERKTGHTNSIETVFRMVAGGLSKLGIDAHFTQAPFGNTTPEVFKNLLFFRKGVADIYHVTGHVQYLTMLLSRRNSVLTIHDMGILKIRSGFRRWVLKKLFFDWPCKRARFVTVISERTRMELLEMTECPADKIRIIRNPVRENFIADKPGEFNPDLPVVLQIGTGPEKNLPVTIAALKNIKCVFRIVGNLTEVQLNALTENNIDYVNVSGLSDDELKDEYLNADLVVFCSTFEGFGLPIIEAQATGTPLVTSDLSPMKEVAGDGATLVDPHDVKSIERGILEVINDGERRKATVAAGRENIKRFSALDVASLYADLYSEILAEK